MWGAGGHLAAQTLPAPQAPPGLEAGSLVGVRASHGGGDMGSVVGAGLSFPL